MAPKETFNVSSRNPFAGLEDASSEGEEPTSIAAVPTPTAPSEAKPQQRKSAPQSPSSKRGGPRPGATRHRDFDRHVSGTGRGRGMKRQGGGAHNWGNREPDFGGEMGSMEWKGTNSWDDIKGNDTRAGQWNGETSPAEKTGEVAAAAEKEAVGDASSPDAADGAGGNNAMVDVAAEGPNRDSVVGAWDDDETPEEKKAPEAPEVNSMGLEEYLQQQAVKRANLPTLPGRTGVSSAALRNELEREGYTLHVKEVEADSKRKRAAANAIGTSPDISDRPLRSRESLHRTIETEFVRDLGRSRGRGGRGGGRGGRFESGGARDQKHDKMEIRSFRVDLKDEYAFPSL